MLGEPVAAAAKEFQQPQIPQHLQLLPNLRLNVPVFWECGGSTLLCHRRAKPAAFKSKAAVPRWNRQVVARSVVDRCLS